MTQKEIEQTRIMRQGFEKMLQNCAIAYQKANEILEKETGIKPNALCWHKAFEILNKSRLPGKILVPVNEGIMQAVNYGTFERCDIGDLIARYSRTETSCKVTEIYENKSKDVFVQLCTFLSNFETSDYWIELADL